MNCNEVYLRQLENLIRDKLLPVYNKYYTLVDEEKPTLELPVLLKLDRKVPALLKPIGDLTFTSNGRKPRKN